MCTMDPSSHVHHHHHHQQEMSSQTLESMLVCTKPEQEKKPRPAEQQPQKCPRCDSANTKFCYYNNYSLSQPRYFCKSCRRYWTKGGTLRNVPVGGGCRKNKRPSSSSKRSQDNSPNSNNPISPLSIPTISSYDHSSTDLSLAFARLQKQASGHLGIDQEHDDDNNNNNSNMSMLYNPDNTSTTVPSSFLDALRGGSFLENAPNGFHHKMYYGNYGGILGANSEEMGMNYDQEMSIGTTSASTTMTTTVKQEMCGMARSTEGDQNNNSKALWGFPWQQMNEDHLNNMNMSDFESTNRQNWSAFGVSSNWHGLINSPLM